MSRKDPLTVIPEVHSAGDAAAAGIRVPFVRPTLPPYEAVRAAYEEILGSGRLTKGVYVERLEQAGVPTHYLGIAGDRWMLVRPVKVIPLEVVIRNLAAGSLCRQLPIAPGTALSPPLLDLYYKDDAFGDPLLTEARLERLALVTAEQRSELERLARWVNAVLRELFATIQLELVDFKLEFGYTAAGELVLADEISPDTCRLWDGRIEDPNDRILDKDRFRQDLGGVIEAYGEVFKRVQAVCPEPRLYW
jgi:phosphoribosylaminoimidazole-succinocarboxamide synthase